MKYYNGRSIFAFYRFSMLNRYLTFYNSPIQFVVFCAILSMSFLVGGSLIEFLNTQIIGFSNEEILGMKDISSELSNKLKFVNATLLAITLLLPAIIFSYLAYPKPSKYLGLDALRKKHHLLWGITLILIAIPFTSLLEEWSQLIPAIGNSKELDEKYNQLATSMLKGTSLIDLFSNIFFICIMPALIEEIFFRGCLQNILLHWMRKTPIAAILLVAVLFSVFHGQLSGFFPRIFLGLLLGLSYYYSGSLWVSMFMHVVNNLVTVVFVYLFNNQITDIDLTKLPAMNIWLGLLSFIAVIAMVYLFYKDRKEYEIIEVEKEELPKIQ